MPLHHRWMQNIHSFAAVLLLSRLKSPVTNWPIVARPHRRTLSAAPACPYHVRLARPADGPEIVRFVEWNLLPREPLLRALNVGAIERCRAQLLDEIRRVLRESVTLLAEKTHPEPPEKGPPPIVGVALNRRSWSGDGKRLADRADRTQHGPLRKLLYIWSIVAAEPNLHQHFCTRCLFEIAFLIINSDAEMRQGVGLHLTRHSLELARALGYHYARMNCTCEDSSRIASNAGLECRWTVAYHHLVDGSNHPVVQPEPPHTHIKVHATALPPIGTHPSHCIKSSNAGN
uniref:N-acetyltransferase domain-containing protein n=1 Tax=Anopheles farauti TaxID=69004 RepID=A0A182QUS6_9DIPT